MSNFYAVLKYKGSYRIVLMSSVEAGWKVYFMGTHEKCQNWIQHELGI